MRVIELGNGTVRITPCFVSAEDRRQALLFEPEQEPQKIGSLTGRKPGVYSITKPKDTLIILGSVEAGEVLLRQVMRCVEDMRLEQDSGVDIPKQVKEQARILRNDKIHNIRGSCK